MNSYIPTHLSLFSGIGGLDLAAEAAGFRTVGQCEWADYPTKVLEKHWPDVPRWKDIRTLTKESFYERTGLRTVELISGGFPCQPFSCAGKRRGKDDDRYLWPEMLRVINELRPTWVVGENVANIVNMALDQVLSDLEDQGYQTRAFIIPACGVDAPHQRDRCAIVAWNNDSQPDRRKSFSAFAGAAERQNPEPGGICDDVANCYSVGLEMPRAKQPSAGATGSSSDVANAYSEGFQGSQQYCSLDTGRKAESCRPTGKCRQALAYADQSVRDGIISSGDTSGWPRPADSGADVSDAHDGGWTLRRDGELSTAQGPGSIRSDYGGGTPEYGCWEWWPAEPDVGRVAHGIPSRVDRLKCLGNAVVPAQFFPVFQAIYHVFYEEAQL